MAQPVGPPKSLSRTNAELISYKPEQERKVGNPLLAANADDCMYTYECGGWASLSIWIWLPFLPAHECDVNVNEYAECLFWWWIELHACVYVRECVYVNFYIIFAFGI